MRGIFLFFFLGVPVVFSKTWVCEINDFSSSKIRWNWDGESQIKVIEQWSQEKKDWEPTYFDVSVYEFEAIGQRNIQWTAKDSKKVDWSHPNYKNQCFVSLKPVLTVHLQDQNDHWSGTSWLEVDWLTNPSLSPRICRSPRYPAPKSFSIHCN
ncbi:MAG: hypothetical protein CL678_13345 [Bdellovibrionaceae bacterium]|nr:hypothetical protein [Pseudobdellovibrionaceae bacterium]|tara:strand:+ start:3956 stop:4414 length:459 start_codon:yes stop_codon:yes gene_type:complete